MPLTPLRRCRLEFISEAPPPISAPAREPCRAFVQTDFRLKKFLNGHLILRLDLPCVEILNLPRLICRHRDLVPLGGALRFANLHPRRVSNHAQQYGRYQVKGAESKQNFPESLVHRNTRELEVNCGRNRKPLDLNIKYVK